MPSTWGTTKEIINVLLKVILRQAKYYILDYWTGLGTLLGLHILLSLV